MESNGFFKLKNVPAPVLKDGFALDTLLLEQEMKQNNGGIPLDDVNNYYNPYVNIDKSCRKYVPIFREYDYETIGRVVKKHPLITEPCSMSIDSPEELLEHMTIGYQVAHFHYILGKKHNIKGQFPDKCCGISSVNVTLSLIDLGYPNAAYAYSRERDHGYVSLPFVFKNNNGEEVKGTIIVDPTSDQLWQRRNMRNNVFIRLGSQWEYRTDWASGTNLFPDRIYSIDIMKKEPNLFWDDYYSYPNEARDGQLFFQRAFANPIKIGSANNNSNSNINANGNMDIRIENHTEK